MCDCTQTQYLYHILPKNVWRCSPCPHLSTTLCSVQRLTAPFWASISHGCNVLSYIQCNLMCSPHGFVRRTNVQFLQLPAVLYSNQLRKKLLLPPLVCVLQTDRACLLQCLPSIKSHHMCHTEKDSVWILIQLHWTCQKAQQDLARPHIGPYSSAVSSKVCDWLEDRNGIQLAGEFHSLCLRHCPLYLRALSCCRECSLLTKLTVFSFLTLSPPPQPPFSLWCFFPGQVVYLSHVWRPPKPTPLLSLLRLFRLFYEETHPRARKKQEAQSR